MEQVLPLTEQVCPFENLFTPSRREESAGLILVESCSQLGFLYHETKTYQNGSADLVAAKFGMQPKYTVLLRLY